MERELPYRRLKSLRRKLMDKKLRHLRENIPEDEEKRGRRIKKEGRSFDWRKLLEEEIE